MAQIDRHAHSIQHFSLPQRDLVAMVENYESNLTIMQLQLQEKDALLRLLSTLRSLTLQTRSIGEGIVGGGETDSALRP